MLNKQKYYSNGKVQRVEIVQDIKYGKLTRTDVDELVADKDIEEAFFGISLTSKEPKSQWNDEYMNKLAARAIAENFSPDLLYHLFDVSEYLLKTKDKKKKRTFALVFTVLVIIGIIMFSLHNSSKQQPSVIEQTVITSLEGE